MVLGAVSSNDTSYMGSVLPMKNNIGLTLAIIIGIDWRNFGGMRYYLRRHSRIHLETLDGWAPQSRIRTESCIQDLRSMIQRPREYSLLLCLFSLTPREK